MMTPKSPPVPGTATSTPGDDAQSQISLRRAQTLTSIVRDAIEDMIIHGALRGGDRINESALAERLNVSRGPIREACRSLEQAGLVRNVTNHGAYVRELSQAEARDLYELRAALAAHAARLLVERADDAAIAALAQRVDGMDLAVAADDAEHYYELNLAFHHALIAGSGNQALLATYQATAKQLHLARRRGLVDFRRIAESNAEHRAIVQAAAARDAEACAAAARHHINEGWRRFVGSR